MEVLKVPFSFTKDKNNLNSNNHYEYNPFKVKNKIIEIDRIWYNKLLDISKSRIDQIKNHYKTKITFLEFKYPHDNHKELDNEIDKEIWYNLYYTYLHQYDYEEWYKDLNMNIELVKVNKSDLRILFELCRVRVIRNPSSSWIESQLDDLSEQFKIDITNALKKFNNHCFVKTSKTSGKNEVKLEPKYTLTDVLMHFTSCKEYFKEFKYIIDNDYKFDYSLHFIIMPWNEKLDRDREFRIIVLDNKIKGISQQKWYKKIEFGDSEINKIYESIKKWFSSQTKFPFSDVTIDLWVDKEYNVHIIECNPGGIYSSSGSSLFHWINDYDKLCDETDKTYFKIID